MDNSQPDLPESGPTPRPVIRTRPRRKRDAKSDINVWVDRTTDQAKGLYEDGKEYYRKSPRLQKVVYQGKFRPAFWTVACIFSLFVNIILIGLLIAFGRNFFALKAVIADSLLADTANNLALMDQAHIVMTVPVETTVRLQDTLPVVFDLPINENTQISLSEASTINGARIYLNNTAVTTDLTLPAGTPLDANLSMSIPVSTTVPVDIVVPVTLKIPVDIAIDQTDLHQSIVGLQETIKPYQTVLGSTFSSPDQLVICKNWLTGWLCGLVFGQ